MMLTMVNDYVGSFVFLHISYHGSVFFYNIIFVLFVMVLKATRFFLIFECKLKFYSDAKKWETWGGGSGGLAGGGGG